MGLTLEDFLAKFPDDFPEEGDSIIDRLDARMSGLKEGDELGDLLWDAANIIEWTAAYLAWESMPDAPYFWLGAQAEPRERWPQGVSDMLYESASDGPVEEWTADDLTRVPGDIVQLRMPA
jgi:hypothetical protein